MGSFKLRMHQNPFSPGAPPGAYDAPPNPLVGWGGGHPLRIPLPSTPSASRSRRHPPSSKKNLRPIFAARCYASAA